MTTELRIRFLVDDEAVSRLHTEAFGGDFSVDPWRARLERHSKSWVGAFAEDRLVGFVHAVWDGGRHAFLLDTAVALDHQRQGVGTTIVAALIDDLRAAGLEWLHVDYEPYLDSFYRGACGFTDTGVGILRLN
ncbi:GNAT family N-acetyltransferase [Nocardia sp. NPDC051929]|uniref:GNAT family N-acetyltransferase n=1 Tax=Nocardia sp. NPDC051929 TaxID=3364327 RepID=UPI0037CB3DFA